MAILYIHPETGNDSNNGQSWATAWKTLDNIMITGQVYAGDEVRFAKSPDPVSIGDATWTNNSDTITLASALTKTVSDCDINWTAASGVTCSLNTATERKQGSACLNVQIALPKSTGKLAHISFDETSFSNYQRLTFWFKQTISDLPTDITFRLCLCSDTAGDNVIDSFSFTLPSASITTPYFKRYTINKTGGGNLGNSIRAVALYLDTALSGSGSLTFSIDNIEACTISGLHLGSLITKNLQAFGGNESFYTIKSILGTGIKLERTLLSSITQTAKYYGTTETVETFIRDAFELPQIGGDSYTIIHNKWGERHVNGDITLNYGYDPNTNTQNGLTIYDAMHLENIPAFEFDDCGYITVNRLSLVNSVFHQYAVRSTNTDIHNILNLQNLVSCINPLEIFGTSMNFSIDFINSNSNIGSNYSYLIYLACSDNTLKIKKLEGNYPINDIIKIEGKNLDCYINSIKNNINPNNSVNQNDLFFAKNSVNCRVFNCISSGKIVLEPTSLQAPEGIQAINCKFNSYYSDTGSNNQLIYTNIDNNPLDNRIYGTGQLIQSLASDRDGGSGLMWELQSTNVNRRHFRRPVSLKIAEIAVDADTQVTVNAWMKKTHTTSVHGLLVCKGGQIAGVDDDIAASLENNTDWQELQIQFTPTASGVVEIRAIMYPTTSTSAKVFIDTIAIT